MLIVSYIRQVIEPVTTDGPNTPPPLVRPPAMNVLLSNDEIHSVVTNGIK